MELIWVELPGVSELAECYASQGHHVLMGQTEPSIPSPSLPVVPLTCVNVAKRALAIRADWIWTPRQLFRHLLRAQPRRWHQVPGRGAVRDCVASTLIEA
jgi:hypothetical protein